MTEQILFDEDYTGPRWTYGLHYRPIDVVAQPKGWITGSGRKHPDYLFGTVDYPRELSDKEVRSFELESVSEAWS